MSRLSPLPRSNNSPTPEDLAGVVIEIEGNEDATVRPLFFEGPPAAAGDAATTHRPASQVADYLAAQQVASLFADAGWNLYFPQWKCGFDFVAAKATVDGEQLLRPVQVRAKYPSADQSDREFYGLTGKSGSTHPELVLAIPYFAANRSGRPVCVAFLPTSLIDDLNGEYRAEPASLRSGLPSPRPEYARFFDATGLALVETPDWKYLTV